MEYLEGKTLEHVILQSSNGDGEDATVSTDVAVPNERTKITSTRAISFVRATYPVTT